MQTQARIISLAALMLVCATARGAEPATSIDTILANWERASKERSLIDATFVRWTIDDAFGRKEVHRGRFYWESSNRCVYQVKGESRLIWNEGLLCIDDEAKDYRQFTERMIGYAREQGSRLDEQPDGFWNSLYRGMCMYVCMAPEDILPLCTTIDAAAVSKRFELKKWTDDEENIKLRALPTSEKDKRSFREINVLLDRQTFEVIAQRVVRAGDGKVVIHKFARSAADGPPADRDQLFSPNLYGFEDKSPELDDAALLLQKQSDQRANGK